MVKSAQLKYIYEICLFIIGVNDSINYCKKKTPIRRTNSRNKKFLGTCVKKLPNGKQ